MAPQYLLSAKCGALHAIPQVNALLGIYQPNALPGLPLVLAAAHGELPTAGVPNLLASTPAATPLPGLGQGLGLGMLNPCRLLAEPTRTMGVGALPAAAGSPQAELAPACKPGAPDPSRDIAPPIPDPGRELPPTADPGREPGHLMRWGSPPLPSSGGAACGSGGQASRRAYSWRAVGLARVSCCMQSSITSISSWGGVQWSRESCEGGVVCCPPCGTDLRAVLSCLVSLRPDSAETPKAA